MKKYVLDKDGKTPILEPDIIKWAKWFEKADSDRIINQDEFNGEISVSTVFSGIDYNFLGDGPPILWETMVFGGKYDGDRERYSSYDDALMGHEKMVRLVRLFKKVGGKK